MDGHARDPAAARVAAAPVRARSACRRRSPSAPSTSETWEREDLDEFTDHVHWTAVPFGRTIVVRGEANGHADPAPRLRPVASGRMTDLEIPPGVPWMQRTDQLPFPVEWSARVTDRGRRQGRPGDAAQHPEDPRTEGPLRARAPRAGPRRPGPAGVEGARVEDEISMGLSGLSTRTTGWYRLAVSGDTEEEALERAGAVRKLFAPQITIARPADQYAVAREFIPGEKLGTTAYRRRMPVTTSRGRRPGRDREGRRPGRHPPGGDLRHVRARRHLGAVAGDRAGRGVRACGDLRRPRRREVDRRRQHHLPHRHARRLRGRCSTHPGGSPRCVGCPSWLPSPRRSTCSTPQPGALCAYRVIAEPRREHSLR